MIYNSPPLKKGASCNFSLGMVAEVEVYGLLDDAREATQSAAGGYRAQHLRMLVRKLDGDSGHEMGYSF